MGGNFQGRWHCRLRRIIFRLFPVMLTLLSAPVLGSCERRVLEHYASTDEAKVARKFADQLHRGDIEAIAKELDPGLVHGDPRLALQAMANYLPDDAPLQIELIHYGWQSQNGVNQYDFTYQYSYPAAWFLVDVAFRPGQSAPALTNLQVYQIPESMERQSEINFSQHPGIVFTQLVAGLLNLAFSIVTLVRTWRSPIPRRRWLWRIAVLCGVGSWTVNLHSGAWTWQTLFIVLPVTTGSIDTYEPPLIALHLPIFALIYWLCQNRRYARGLLVQDDIASKF